MGEDNQSKWVGIRPTNPPENIPVTESSPLTEIDINPAAGMGNIPVTESSPLTNILVAPAAAGTEFKTLTKKRSPAVADLQAVSAFVRKYEAITDVGGTGYAHQFYIVPTGKILLLSYIQAQCNQADPTDVQFTVWSTPTHYVWYAASYAGAGTIHRQFPNIYYDSGEMVYVYWLNTIASNDVSAYMFGHLIDKY